MFMEDKKFIIEAHGEAPYALRINEGYELVSNDRTMRLLIGKVSYTDDNTGQQGSIFRVACFVREDGGWIKTSEESLTKTITDYVKQLNKSLQFTKAVKEYREQMDISDHWSTQNMRLE